VYVDDNGLETDPQLDRYLAARAAYLGPLFPALGNHECATATTSNCGPGSTSGTPRSYTTYLRRMVEPLGVSTPYYLVRVTPRTGDWTAKIVVVAANAWSSAQATWLEAALAEPTTYTFVTRHTPDREDRAPGGPPSKEIIDRYPRTMLLVGHSHSYDRLAQRELLVGNGGAPATGSAPYGYVIARRRDDGAIEFSAHRWDNRQRFDQFAVWADGSSAP
jgi:glycine/D-amino acid oxidase-like deaminating enzyme